MNAAQDPVLSALNEIVRTGSAAATVTDCATTRRAAARHLAGTHGVGDRPSQRVRGWSPGEHPFLLDLRDSCEGGTAQARAAIGPARVPSGILSTPLVGEPRFTDRPEISIGGFPSTGSHQPLDHDDQEHNRCDRNADPD